MNEWQAHRQSIDLLEKLTWPDGPAEPVFGVGNALSTLAPADNQWENLILPCVFLVPGGGQQDPGTDGNMNIMGTDMIARVINSIPGDEVGQAAILGSNRKAAGVAGQGSSDGRGLLEIQSPFLNTFKQLNNEFGIRTFIKANSRVQGGFDPDLGYVVYRDYLFGAKFTVLEFYHDVRIFNATNPSSGQVDLTWENAPARFDLRENIVRRTSGSTPPTGPTDGTDVPLAGLLDSSVSDTGLTPGTFSYGIFVGYDETISATNERFSDGKTLTIVVT